jgi:FKBP-type peptidyl-prolyl cis-trans isomerase FkpA
LISIEEIEVGEGEEAKHGDTVEVQYRGSFPDGREFDKGTFGFQVGAGRVIKGFDMMVLGMRVGGKRKATIPPEFGYGARGSGSVIPPDATLVFEVELLGIK